MCRCPRPEAKYRPSHWTSFHRMCQLPKSRDFSSLSGSQVQVQARLAYGRHRATRSGAPITEVFPVVDLGYLDSTTLCSRYGLFASPSSTFSQGVHIDDQSYDRLFVRLSRVAAPREACTARWSQSVRQKAPIMQCQIACMCISQASWSHSPNALGHFLARSKTHEKS